MPTKTFRNPSRAFAAAACALALMTLTACGPVLERSEFTKAVMSKSDDEVQKVLGKPASVDASNPDRVVWTYNSMSFDVANGNKRDSKDIVIFARSAATGKLTATDVQFER
jgi:hypothetical protein